MRGRSERIIGFEVDHRPDDNPHRRERLLERMELLEQRALDARAGLVARPKPITKRLDHVVGGNADVSVAVLDHLQHRLQHANDGTIRAVFAFCEPAQPVEVTEELVSAVDEVNNHFCGRDRFPCPAHSKGVEPHPYPADRVRRSLLRGRPERNPW
jgi:hypothetical protein